MYLNGFKIHFGLMQWSLTVDNTSQCLSAICISNLVGFAFWQSHSEIWMVHAHSALVWYVFT